MNHINELLYILLTLLLIGCQLPSNVEEYNIRDELEGTWVSDFHNPYIVELIFSRDKLFVKNITLGKEYDLIYDITQKRNPHDGSIYYIITMYSPFYKAHFDMFPLGFERFELLTYDDNPPELSKLHGAYRKYD